MTGELSKRLAVAAVGIPAAVAVIYAGGWVLGVTMGLIAAGAALEFYQLAGRRQIHAFPGAGALLAGGLVLIAAAHRSPDRAAESLWIAIVITVLFLFGAVVWRRGPEGGPLTAVSATVTGALFPGAALGFAVFLRHIPLPAQVPDRWLAWAGASLVAYPLAVTWVNDSAAYFAGRAWGRRKLMPSVSPGKTVVGAVAGLAGGIAAGWIWGQWVWGAWLGVPIGAWSAAGGGLVLACVAQVGDLAESVLKREADVKDSGTFFPGHGGVLDRFDALFFSVPVAYWLVVWLLSGGAG